MSAPNEARRGFPLEQLVGRHDYRKTHGRSAEQLRRDVLRVAQDSSAVSTFECERDRKLAYTVTTMLERGEVVRGPENYPWVGLRLPANAQVEGPFGPKENSNG